MARVSQVSVSGDGITLRTRTDQPISIRFDDRQIGAFWSLRDTDERGALRHWPWPVPLAQHLDGVTEVVLAEHTSGRELYRDEVRFGKGADRVEVVDAQGNPLGLDKNFRLMRLFGSRSSAQLEPLLDSIAEVVGALQGAGAQPFLAYGTLLGAVRQGGFIGHDSDADLGYVSRHEHPADVISESFQLQRRLVAAGYHVTRYSGVAIKVRVTEGDGTKRGLDVFGGFMRDGRLYLMGEVGHEYEPDWLYPLSTAELEGRSFPVPAVPERLLEAMYGPHWRVPDPAYKFTTPQETRRRLTGWFRGTRVNRDLVWEPFFRGPDNRRLQPLSDLAKWAHRREPAEAVAIDVGCGSGSDVFRLAKRGRRAVGLDYVRRSYGLQARKARNKGLPVRFEFGNLTELRSTLVTGLALRREGESRFILARHVADATTELGRRNLLRLGRIALTGGGRMYVEVLARPLTGRGEPGLQPVDIDTFKSQIAQAGGTLLEERWFDRVDGDLVEGSTSAPAGDVCRLVIEWL